MWRVGLFLGSFRSAGCQSVSTIPSLACMAPARSSCPHGETEGDRVGRCRTPRKLRLNSNVGTPHLGSYGVMGTRLSDLQHCNHHAKQSAQSGDRVGGDLYLEPPNPWAVQPPSRVCLSNRGTARHSRQPSWRPPRKRKTGEVMTQSGVAIFDQDNTP